MTETLQFKMLDLLNEEYRPQEFDEVIGLDPKIPELVAKKDIPHFLFTGPTGTGKTTTAKIIIKKLNADVLILNSSKERGIDVIRDKIEPFATKASDRIKIVFFDEFDATTPQFQTALRNFMEIHSNSTRFIATCNYVNKIIEPVQERFVQFKFSNYKTDDKIKRIKEVAGKENVKISDEVLLLIIKKYKDNIRGMMNLLNKFRGGEITKDNVSYEDIILKILSALKEKKWQEIRGELISLNLDYHDLISEMEKIIFYHKQIPTEVKIKINIICSEAQFHLYFSGDKEMAFSSCLAKIQGAL